MNIWTILVAVVASTGYADPFMLRGVPTPRQVNRHSTQYPTPLAPYVHKSSPSYIPCPLNRARRESLSNEQLKIVLEAQGGTINPIYMSEDAAGARKNFPNMLPIQENLNEKSQKSSSVLKSQLLDDLTKWKTFVKLSSNVRNNNNYHEDKNVINNELGIQNSEKLPSQKGDYLAQELGNFLLKSNIPYNSLIEFIKSANLSVHPRTLMSLNEKNKNSRRIKRNADGSQTTIDYCIQKGSETTDGFINLCTACAVTTKLSSDRFPRYINEVICSATDRACMSLSGTPHGACRESVLYLNLLRKRPDGCMMAIRNPADGQNPTIVQSWEAYTQRIRTGCSCAIDKRSRLVSAFFG